MLVYQRVSKIQLVIAQFHPIWRYLHPWLLKRMLHRKSRRYLHHVTSKQKSLPQEPGQKFVPLAVARRSRGPRRICAKPRRTARIPRTISVETSIRRDWFGSWHVSVRHCRYRCFLEVAIIYQGLCKGYGKGICPPKYGLKNGTAFQVFPGLSWSFFEEVTVYCGTYPAICIHNHPYM